MFPKTYVNLNEDIPCPSLNLLLICACVCNLYVHACIIIIVKRNDLPLQDCIPNCRALYTLVSVKLRLPFVNVWSQKHIWWNVWLKRLVTGALENLVWAMTSQSGSLEFHLDMLSSLLLFLYEQHWLSDQYDTQTKRWKRKLVSR